MAATLQDDFGPFWECTADASRLFDGDFLSSLKTKPDTERAFRSSKRSQRSDLTQSTSSNAFLRREASSINTFDDILHHFAKQDPGTSNQFFYCYREDQGAVYKPYNLVVASKDRLKSESYVVSCQGILHFEHGVQSQFTPMRDWKRDRANFDLISALPLFKHYLVRRSFATWHKVVRLHRFGKVRAVIQERTLFSKPVFGAALQEVHHQVDAISKVQMVSLPEGRLFILEEFRELQSATREQKAKPELQTISDSIRKIVERVSTEVQEKLTRYQDSVSDPAAMFAVTGVELLPGRPPDKSRSMTVIKADQRQRALTFKQVLDEAKHRGAFVRVVDQLMVRQLVGLASASPALLSNTLSFREGGVDLPSKGLLNTAVMFSDDGLLFTPSETAIAEMLTGSVLEGTLKLAHAVPRPLSMRNFSHFFINSKPAGASVEALIRSDDSYNHARRSISATLARDFRDAHNFSRCYANLRDVFDFGRNSSNEAFASQKRTLEEMKAAIEQQRSWRAAVECAKTGAKCGCLFVDARPLKSALLPVTMQALDRLRSTLQSMAREACQAALVQCQADTRALLDRPVNLASFCNFMAQVKGQEGAMTALAKSSATMDDMFASLNTFEQKPPAADLVRHDDLHEAEADLTKILLAAQAFITASIPQQQAALIRACKELLQQVDAASAPTEGTAGSRMDKSTATEAKVQAEQLGKHWLQLGLPTQGPSNATDTSDEIQGHVAIWKAMHRLHYKTPHDDRASSRGKDRGRHRKGKKPAESCDESAQSPTLIEEHVAQQQAEQLHEAQNQLLAS